MAKKLKLRKLLLEDKAEFLQGEKDFKASDPGWEFALDLERSHSFEDYMDKLNKWEQGKELPPNFVPATFRVAVVDDIIVGRVSIRHELNEHLINVGGHVGYGVLPAHRRKGYGKAILLEALNYCKKLGIKKVLVTCDENNTASRRIIESCGGQYENSYISKQSPIPKRRYWIAN